MRRLVAEILETTGYTVLQAGDGPSALELLRRHAEPVELLVTDVVMPGMSGPEVANAVTAMRPGMQVLYTSGYTDRRSATTACSNRGSRSCRSRSAPTT